MNDRQVRSRTVIGTLVKMAFYTEWQAMKTLSLLLEVMLEVSKITIPEVVALLWM